MHKKGIESSRSILYIVSSKLKIRRMFLGIKKEVADTHTTYAISSIQM
jgi:hypothetical protein